MARRLAALVLLRPTLNENYLRVRKHAFSWSGLSRQQERKTLRLDL